MSEMPMVEAVARAIALQDCCDPDFIDTNGRVQWTYHSELARAAIAAMREPTEAMTKAGVRFALAASLGGDYRWPDYIADMHRLQIDAALAVPEEGREL